MTLSELNSVFKCPVYSQWLSQLGIRTHLERRLRNQLVGSQSSSQDS